MCTRCSTPKHHQILWIKKQAWIIGKESKLCDKNNTTFWKESCLCVQTSISKTDFSKKNGREHQHITKLSISTQSRRYPKNFKQDFRTRSHINTAPWVDQYGTGTIRHTMCWFTPMPTSMGLAGGGRHRARGGRGRGAEQEEEENDMVAVMQRKSRQRWIGRRRWWRVTQQGEGEKGEKERDTTIKNQLSDSHRLKK